jgi:hypothetical protein
VKTQLQSKTASGHRADIQNLREELTKQLLLKDRKEKCQLPGKAKKKLLYK